MKQVQYYCNAVSSSSLFIVIIIISITIIIITYLKWVKPCFLIFEPATPLIPPFV